LAVQLLLGFDIIRMEPAAFLADIRFLEESEVLTAAAPSLMSGAGAFTVRAFPWTVIALVLAP
jgi:hypothetical protein